MKTIPALETLKSINIDEIKTELAELENELEKHIELKKSEIQTLKRLIRAVEYARGDQQALLLRNGNGEPRQKRTYTRRNKGFDERKSPTIEPPFKENQLKEISNRKPQTDESVADAAYIYLQVTGMASCRAIGESLKLIDPSSARRILRADARFAAVSNKVDWFELAK